MHALFLVCAAASGGDGAILHWEDRELAAGELPAEIAGEARVAVETWAPFADERDFEMYLVADERVLFLSPRKRRANRADVERIEAAAAYLDRLLPAPPPPAQGAHGAGPESGARGGGRGDEDGWTVSWTWGAAEWRRDHATAVLIQARNEADYGPALEHLAARHEHLRGFAETARRLAGVSLESPLAAIWLLSGEGLEEHRPENELVHRVTAMLVLRRFGHQPPWVQQGLAWHVEHELLKTHYCFPWRDEFVFTAEHTGWDAALKTAHRKADALALEDVVALRRGAFDALAAQRAWGAMTFLARFHADRLPAMLEELRLLREEKGRVAKPDGTWELVPGYEPSPEDQLPILQRAAGADVMAEMLAFFQKGKAYKPKG